MGADSHWTEGQVNTILLNGLTRDQQKLARLIASCKHEPDIVVAKGEVAPFGALCKHCGAFVEVKR